MDDGAGYGTVGADIRFDPDDPIYYPKPPVIKPDDTVTPAPKPSKPVQPAPKPPTPAPAPKPTVCRSRGFYRDGVYQTDEADNNDNNTVVPTEVLPSDATIVTPGE